MTKWDPDKHPAGCFQHMVVGAFPIQLTLYVLNKFLEEQHYPDVVLVSPRDYVELLMTHGLSDNDAHTIHLLGTIWKRGAGVLGQLDWSDKHIGEANGQGTPKY